MHSEGGKWEWWDEESQQAGSVQQQKSHVEKKTQKKVQKWE